MKKVLMVKLKADAGPLILVGKTFSYINIRHWPKWQAKHCQEQKNSNNRQVWVTLQQLLRPRAIIFSPEEESQKSLKHYGDGSADEEHWSSVESYINFWTYNISQKVYYSETWWDVRIPLYTEKLDNLGNVGHESSYSDQLLTN